MMSQMTAFEQEQYADSYPPGIENHWWTRARSEIICRALCDLAPTVVLDVGCGTGLTVAFLRQRGFDCWGSEIGHPVVHGSAEPFVWCGRDATTLDPGFRDRVGVVLLLDVLEHLPQPDLFLHRLLDAFRNIQNVIVTVPARKELWSAWDDRYGHFRRYDRRSLSTLLQQGGLDIRRLRYVFNSIYLPLFVASRMNTRRVTVKSPRLLWPHAVISAWLQAESRIPGIGWMPGTSLLATGVPRRS